MEFKTMSLEKRTLPEELVQNYKVWKTLEEKLGKGDPAEKMPVSEEGIVIVTDSMKENVLSIIGEEAIRELLLGKLEDMEGKFKISGNITPIKGSDVANIDGGGAREAIAIQAIRKQLEEGTAVEQLKLPDDENKVTALVQSAINSITEQVENDPVTLTQYLARKEASAVKEVIKR